MTKTPDVIYVIVDKNGEITSNLMTDWHEAIKIAREQITKIIVRGEIEVVSGDKRWIKTYKLVEKAP